MIIREMIAESGHLKVKDAVEYVLRRLPNVDKKLVTKEAKELISQAKKFNKL